MSWAFHILPWHVVRGILSYILLDLFLNGTLFKHIMFTYISKLELLLEKYIFLCVSSESVTICEAETFVCLVEHAFVTTVYFVECIVSR